MTCLKLYNIRKLMKNPQRVYKGCSKFRVLVKFLIKHLISILNYFFERFLES